MVQAEKLSEAVAMAALPAAFPFDRDQNIPASAPDGVSGKRPRGRRSHKECKTCTAREVPFKHSSKYVNDTHVYVS